VATKEAAIGGGNGMTMTIGAVAEFMKDAIARDGFDAAAVAHLKAGLDPLAADVELARAWRAAKAHQRALGLRPVLADVALGPALRDALLDSAESDDARSGSAALAVLGGAAAVELADGHWRRIARLARKERPLPLPDRDAATLVARRGPDAALATVALTALRCGPEDADDRAAAIAGLGRFDDARVTGWLARLAETGVHALDIVQALAQASARVAPDRQADLATAWTPVLVPLLGTHDPALPRAITDAWARWSALDGLCHLLGAAALPYALAVWRAGGDDLPPWFASFCRQRTGALSGEAKPDLAKLVQHQAVGAVPTLLPLPGISGRVMARCPRVARRALVEWQGQHGDGSALERQRAAIEQALVARGQLSGSLIAMGGIQGAALDDTWRPSAEILSDAERADLQREEANWLR
jgi:hypothetical protein